jgi:hypothetical protein
MAKPLPKLLGPQDADRLLASLVVSCRADAPMTPYSLQDFADETQLQPNEVSAILKYFHRRGFIEFSERLGGSVLLSLLYEGHEFGSAGGFEAEAELMQNQIVALQKIAHDLQSKDASLSGKAKEILDVTEKMVSVLSGSNGFIRNKIEQLLNL